jgi:UDP-N-acetylmuramyl pentapeptide phosphotransferase/UDP-N-acetylglucosamine-1-phosphate transferase
MNLIIETLSNKPIYFGWVMAFALLFGYLKIAPQYNIIDKPNQRSSHTNPTIRGAGIVFPMLFVFFVLMFGHPGGLVDLIMGITLLGVVSFYDDVKDVPFGLRLFAQLIAAGLLFNELFVWLWPIWAIVIAGILVIATINAFNFMDGINGISGIYGLVTAISLYTVKQDIALLGLIAALMAFLFFNLRKKAKCFSGDVGAVSLAFIFSFYVLQISIESKNPIWILLLGVYGIDAAITIIFRLIRKENILRGHRSHFYQILANEKQMPHVTVSLIYGLTQAIFNGLFFYFFNKQQMTPIIIAFTGLVILYLVLRFTLEGKTLVQKKQL